MNIGVIGYGPFGKLLTDLLIESHCYNSVRVANRLDENYIQDRKCSSQERLHELYSLDDVSSFAKGLEVIVLAVSISSLESVVRECPPDVFCDKLVVDVCSVKMHPRSVLLNLLPPSADLLCSHPMFGPNSASAEAGLKGKKLMYELTRITDSVRSEAFLGVWRSLQCELVEMSCEEHDQHAAKSQFMTHFISRSLSLCLDRTPIDTPSALQLRDLSVGICGDSKDLFHALYHHNPFAPAALRLLRDAMSAVENELQSSSRSDGVRANEGGELTV